MAVQQYCVCHHCRDGHASKDQLAFMVSKYHSECQGCSKDEKCAAERSLDEEKKEKFKSLRADVADYLEHKEIADHQAGAMRKAKEELKDGECLVIEDFAERFLVKADLELTQNDYFARFGVPDLVVCVYYKEQGETTCEIFNFLAKTKEKEDFYFLREAWMTLLDTPLLKKFQTIKTEGPSISKFAGASTSSACSKRHTLRLFSGTFSNRAMERGPATLMLVC